MKIEDMRMEASYEELDEITQRYGDALQNAVKQTIRQIADEHYDGKIAAQCCSVALLSIAVAIQEKISVTKLEAINDMGSIIVKMAYHEMGPEMEGRVRDLFKGVDPEEREELANEIRDKAFTPKQVH